MKINLLKSVSFEYPPREEQRLSWLRLNVTFILIMISALIASYSTYAQGEIKWPKEDNLVFQRITGNQANAGYGFIDLYGYLDQNVTNIRVTFEKIPVPNNAGVDRKSVV